MVEWSVLEMIRWGGFAGVLVGVVVIFLLAPGVARDRAAWITTTLFYVAVLAIFLDLFVTVWTGSAAWTERAPRIPLLLGLGFLAFMFSAGTLVSTVKTIGRLRSGAGSGADVVH